MVVLVVAEGVNRMGCFAAKQYRYTQAASQCGINVGLMMSIKVSNALTSCFAVCSMYQSCTALVLHTYMRACHSKVQ